MYCFVVVANETQGIDNPCGITKPMAISKSSKGGILSPNYPDVYPNGADCQWRIKVDRGYLVKLTFIKLDLEDG